MKQLDFFFDMISRLRSSSSLDSSPQKQLVAGGRQAPQQDVILVHGHPIRIKRRPYARHMSLSVRPGRISLTAGRTVPVKMLIKFTLDSWNWVESQKKFWEELQAKYPKKQYASGEIFPIQGVDHSLKLQLVPGRRGQARAENGVLIAEVPEKYATSAEQAREFVRSSVRGFYEDLGRRVISERLHFFSKEMELFPREVSYRCQKTRWGSCSSNGHISFNWRLSAVPLEVLDYVVVHELAHLKHHNHSRNFWKLVERHSPRWRKIRKWLAENQYSLDFLAEVSEVHGP